MALDLNKSARNCPPPRVQTPQRATTVQGLRSIFRALKAARLVFSDPTFRIHVLAAQFRIPPALDLAALRAELNSPRPARAAIAALLGFHGIRIGQLCKLELTDVRDGHSWLRHPQQHG